jgi:hypothetical protein
MIKSWHNRLIGHIAFCYLICCQALLIATPGIPGMLELQATSSAIPPAAVHAYPTTSWDPAADNRCNCFHITYLLRRCAYMLVNCDGPCTTTSPPRPITTQAGEARRNLLRSWHAATPALLKLLKLLQTALPSSGDENNSGPATIHCEQHCMTSALLTYQNKHAMGSPATKQGPHSHPVGTKQPDG